MLTLSSGSYRRQLPALAGSGSPVARHGQGRRYRRMHLRSSEAQIGSSATITSGSAARRPSTSNGAVSGDTRAAAARSGARCCRASSQRSALMLPVLAPAVTCTWVPSAGGRPREFVSRTVSTSGPSTTGASRRSCFCSNAGRSGPKTQTLTIAAPGPCRRSSRGDSPAGTTPGRPGAPSGAA